VCKRRRGAYVLRCFDCDSGWTVPDRDAALATAREHEQGASWPVSMPDQVIENAVPCRPQTDGSSTDGLHANLSWLSIRTREARPSDRFRTLQHALTHHEPWRFR
jgi:hypothetical protein